MGKALGLSTLSGIYPGINHPMVGSVALYLFYATAAGDTVTLSASLLPCVGSHRVFTPLHWRAALRMKWSVIVINACDLSTE